MANCRTERCPPRRGCEKCDAARARQRKTLLAKYHARRASIIEMLGGKCSECDVTDNLEIDHIDQSQKSFYVSRCMTLSMPKLLSEISKCRLLCHDHHEQTASYPKRLHRGNRRTGAGPAEVPIVDENAEPYVEPQDIEF